MSTHTVSPLRQRLIEDMIAPSSVRARSEVTFAPASDLPRFSSGRLIQPPFRMADEFPRSSAVPPTVRP
jgi:hypothetical protein